MTHGSDTRHRGRSLVWSRGATVSAADAARRLRSRARTTRPKSSNTNGTDELNPLIPDANVAYPRTRFWAMPSTRPPTNANGTDRNRPMTAAAAATNITVV